MMITKKDPLRSDWYMIGNQETKGKKLDELFAISWTSGYPPRDYMRDLRKDEDSEDSEDEYRRRRRRHDFFDDDD